MSKEIILKTDASYKKDIGCGVSFSCEVKEDGNIKRIHDKKFLEKIESSTDAELTATVFGLTEIVKEINEPKEYIITVSSDCEYVVESFKKRYPNQPKLIRVGLNLLDFFAGWSIRWIPRVKNREADSLAKSALMKGEDELW